MFKIIIAYIIAFLLSPIIGGISGILLTPLLPILKKIGISFVLIRLVTSVIIGYISVWFSTVVFSWFGLEVTLLMIIIIAVGFILNDFRRISRSSKTIVSSEIAAAIGDLLGIIIGGIYFLP